MVVKTGKRSRKLGKLVDGAGDGSRTRDLLLGKQTLYQLSYSRPASEYTVTVW